VIPTGRIKDPSNVQDYSGPTPPRFATSVFSPRLPGAQYAAQALLVVLTCHLRRMQFTTLISLALALAHISVVMGSPSALHARAQCPLLCVNDAECVDCPFDVRYTCITAGVPGSEGVRFPSNLHEEASD
jgi:hypothetical protein